MAIFCFPLQARGQESQSVGESNFHVVQADTILLDTFLIDHSPRKAAMYSAVFPGMGQIYNKKFWKLPIVYGGLGGLGYSAIWNSRQHKYFLDLYKIMEENDYEEYEGRTFKEVEFYKKSHLRYKNLMIILTIGFYAIQIVDASVDAHLIDYDISEDLSFTVDPVMLDPAIFGTSLDGGGGNNASFGLRCCLSF